MEDIDKGEDIVKGRRLFSRLMKEECWKKSKSVPGRDPDRWKYDATGRVVCRALTSCTGPLCHEYDHIRPYSKGGQTSTDNCQILQTRVNRMKKDRIESSEQLAFYGYNHTFSHEELDLMEMACYGNVRKVVEGPVPGYFTSFMSCECETFDTNTAAPHPCTAPDYSRNTKIDNETV